MNLSFDTASLHLHYSRRSAEDEEDWGAKPTLPRSISQPANGMHDNSRPSSGHPDSWNDPNHRYSPSLERPHSWQNGHGEYGRSPPREDNRPRNRSLYEEVPRKDRPRSLQPDAYPHRGDHERYADAPSGRGYSIN